MDNKERMNLYGLIKQANESIKTTDIKGKDYAEVNQRIKAFRMVYPDGFITTIMESNENGVCVFRCQVGFYLEDGSMRILGSGTAYEKEGSTFINKTSYIEKMKEIKEAEDALKAAILEEMESKNILSIKTNDMTITYVAPSDRETFDSKKLREEKPDLYDEYVKISPVKSSIRIKLK